MFKFAQITSDLVEIKTQIHDAGSAKTLTNFNIDDEELPGMPLEKFDGLKEFITKLGKEKRFYSDVVSHLLTSNY
jgi:hypothetical protein